jgi:hypothetical protein
MGNINQVNLRLTNLSLSLVSSMPRLAVVGLFYTVLEKGDDWQLKVLYKIEIDRLFPQDRLIVCFQPFF